MPMIKIPNERYFDVLKRNCSAFVEMQPQCHGCTPLCDRAASVTCINSPAVNACARHHRGMVVCLVEVDELHAKYVDALRELFDANKGSDQREKHQMS
eukprot:733911-Amphidinium_carterae.1